MTKPILAAAPTCKRYIADTLSAINLACGIGSACLAAVDRVRHRDCDLRPNADRHVPVAWGGRTHRRLK